MELSFKVLLQLCLLVCLTLLAQVSPCQGQNKVTMTEVKDVKEWKKLVKLKTNVLIYFAEAPRPAPGTVLTLKVLQEAAEVIRGIGTIAFTDCSSSEGKKLCKKLKVGPSPLPVLKHYHNGEFNVNYDRALRPGSVVSFMRDPTGDLPWDEDPTAQDVLHLPNLQALLKLVKRESSGVLVLFYTPWCGYCKKMKPDYAGAAGELKEEAILAAIDVNQPANQAVSKKFNVTGFPTLLYFKNGAMKQQYEGENNKDSIVSFMRNPDAPPVQKPKESNWADEPSHIVHLNTANFDSFLKETPSVLVMFYAPWCGYCKKLKPAYAAAAEQLKDLGVTGKLAAVDATREPELGKRFGVTGYPTMKYFSEGELSGHDVGSLRDEDSLVDFMKDPKEPPAPPPPEVPWTEDQNSPVVHLTEDNFKTILKRKKHALVMFYAPWCGHCKSAKPELIAAAEELKDDPKVLFGAVDCTLHQTLCTSYGVTGYPTFKHFQYFNKEEVKNYDGPRKKNDLTNEVGGTLAPVRAHYPDWEGNPGSEFVHKLTDDALTDFLKARESVLVMFYAPWCGHCKTAKPEFGRAAISLARDSPRSVLAAIDCVQYPRVLERYRIQGYPTLKYYRYGHYIGEYNETRRAADFISFMLRPPKGKDEL